MTIVELACQTLRHSNKFANDMADYVRKVSDNELAEYDESLMDIWQRLEDVTNLHAQGLYWLFDLAQAVVTFRKGHTTEAELTRTLAAYPANSTAVARSVADYCAMHPTEAMSFFAQPVNLGNK